MKIARTLQGAAGFGPSAVTIGNFDGTHIGHRQLLRGVVEAARERGLHATVLTFDPHPAAIVTPERPLRLLSTHTERSTLMQREGIEQVLILPFTFEVASMTPEEFVEHVLVGTLGARVVVVGENFWFGHKQAGNTRVLAELGERFGFETRIMGAVKRRGRIVSSSEVRRAVETGDVALAARLLERCYALEGEVIEGHGIGAKQMVPTLNLRTPAEVIPCTGVYITRTADLDRIERRWDSVTNVGYRPTFGGRDLSIETFLLSAFKEPAPARIRVEFLRRLREERKFETPEALKAQILRDVARAQAFFRRTRKWAAGALK
jgi:riboflavin kinase / FMN adenylyltransferase